MKNDVRSLANVYIIEVACTDIENDKEIARTFIQCVKIAGIDSSSIVFPKIYNEISKKDVSCKSERVYDSCR